MLQIRRISAECCNILTNSIQHRQPMQQDQQRQQDPPHDQPQEQDRQQHTQYQQCRECDARGSGCEEGGLRTQRLECRDTRCAHDVMRCCIRTLRVCEYAALTAQTKPRNGPCRNHTRGNMLQTPAYMTALGTDCCAAICTHGR